MPHLRKSTLPVSNNCSKFLLTEEGYRPSGGAFESVGLVAPEDSGLRVQGSAVERSGDGSGLEV